MDEELKTLVKRVESCFPERTKNTQVIDVATVLLVKAEINAEKAIAFLKKMGYRVVIVCLKVA